MMRDQRYQSIRPLFLKNKIQTFRDIFNVVPRSVVASDLGKENDRFMELTGNLGEFTIQELALIGNFCSLTLSEMFTLIGKEYPVPEIIADDRDDYRYEIVRSNYDEGNIQLFGDIFNYIPVSKVAVTIHKNRSRLAKSIKTQIKNLTLAPLVTIGTLCHLTVSETLQLIETQYQQQKLTQKRTLKKSS